MYILKVNKIIKVVNNCTTFLTVLQEEYTMTGLDMFVVVFFKVKCIISVPLSVINSLTIKTLPQNYAIG